MTIEQKVAQHYGRSDLEQAILDALKAAGRDVDNLSPSDLGGADEFHLGWRPATLELARHLRLVPGMHLIDLGSGLGGPARVFAKQYGCRVTGIDLTPEFVRVAHALTRRCGLADLVSFRVASAVSLPFANGTFERASLIHVGMNIADKARLFAEAARVLKPGGLFGVYDIMRTGPDPLAYPMPWAKTAETSFVETPETYRALLGAAGFAIEQEYDRRGFTLDLWRQMREHAAKHGPPALGPHLLMGPAAPQLIGNVMAALERATIAPVEMLARAA